MADTTLYNSYSVEKTADEISGSMTIWQDLPSSPYDIGDTFRPVPNGPLLNVNRVNISDNVIGELNGKPLRQWQVVIEGSTEEQATGDTNIKYNFNMSSDEKSGSMEVANKGNAPIFSLNIGDNFEVPGVGFVKCTAIHGSDNYNENGIHIWTTNYEGVAGLENDDDTTETKYSLSIAKDEKSGSMEVTNKGNSPQIEMQVGQSFNVPGLGSIKCTGIKSSNSFNEHGVQSWTVTYEGSQGDPDVNADIKYSFTISSTNKSSGSMEVVNSGDRPVFSLHVQERFYIPGIGFVKCTSIRGSDSYDTNGKHTWTTTYEGEEEKPDVQNDKYNLSIDENKKSSGSLEVIKEGQSPVFDYTVGDNFSIPGIGTVKCTGVRSSNSFDDNGVQSWTITYEGEKETSSSSEYPVKYSFTIDKENETGSMEVTSVSVNPNIVHHIGNSFSIPGLGSVKCTNIRVSSGDMINNNQRVWTVTYEGFTNGANGSSSSNLPEEEITTSYELNGITVRTVAGEFLALRRSQTPIKRQSIIIYTRNDSAVASIGQSYKGGIAISENVVKEIIKVNGIKKTERYKHTIEVES
ncbi:MAG: hypothetical protein IJP96_05090 [Synergistaceae bacterium]|nr:hypothetical protein [Synergistaceae bacterium]